MKQYIATSTIPPFGRKGDSSRGWRYQKTQKTDVYDAIVASGANGTTRPEIAKVVNLAPDRISFYLSDLRRAGFIAVKGDPTTVSASMNAGEAALAAMLGLENAFIAKLKENPLLQKDAELTKSFLRYQKLKEVALSASATVDPKHGYKIDYSNEVKQGLRLSLIELVKLVY